MQSTFRHPAPDSSATTDGPSLTTDAGATLPLPAHVPLPGAGLLARRRAVFAANTSWYLYNHHRHILTAFLEAGCEVYALTPDDAYAGKLAALGCRRITLPLVPASRNPLREARALAAFVRAYRALRPDFAFHFTTKCNLYGSLAAGLLRLPHVNNICGLGSAFEDDRPLNRAVQAAYRFAQRRAARVFFQSPADFETMRARGMVREAQALLLPGSGVNLDRFRPHPRAPGSGDSGGPVFVFAGRLLREKGLAELAEAMRRVRAAAPGARCRVYGFLAPGDPRYVSRAELAAWEAEGLMEYRGPLEDVRAAYEGADCAVLPTYYREGVPKSLLEAAAMGLPLVATSIMGCRAVVEDGVNGFLCAPRDAESLADALRRVIALGPEGRARLGRRARERVEADFSEERVREAYLEAALRILKPPAP